MHGSNFWILMKLQLLGSTLAWYYCYTVQDGLAHLLKSLTRAKEKINKQQQYAILSMVYYSVSDTGILGKIDFINRISVWSSASSAFNNGDDSAVKWRDNMTSFYSAQPSM